MTTKVSLNDSCMLSDNVCYYEGEKYCEVVKAQPQEKAFSLDCTCTGVQHWIRTGHSS